MSGTSIAVIGMIGEDARGPEQLLRKHCPGEHMRPRRGTERQQQVGLVLERLIMAVGGADQEARLAPAIVAPAFEFLREFNGGKGLAALVQHNRHAIAQRIGCGSAAIGQLGNLGRPIDPLQISLCQLRLGRSPP